MDEPGGHDGPSDAPDFDPFACAPHVRVPTLFAMSPADEMPGAVSAVTRAVFELHSVARRRSWRSTAATSGSVEHPSVAFDDASRAAELSIPARTWASPHDRPNGNRSIR